MDGGLKIGALGIEGGGKAGERGIGWGVFDCGRSPKRNNPERLARCTLGGNGLDEGWLGVLLLRCDGGTSID